MRGATVYDTMEMIRRGFDNLAYFNPPPPVKKKYGEDEEEC